MKAIYLLLRMNGLEATEKLHSLSKKSSKTVRITTATAFVRLWRDMYRSRRGQQRSSIVLSQALTHSLPQAPPTVESLPRLMPRSQACRVVFSNLVHFQGVQLRFR